MSLSNQASTPNNQMQKTGAILSCECANAYPLLIWSVEEVTAISWNREPGHAESELMA